MTVERFVGLLRSQASAKLKDGHWPVSAWEGAPAVLTALSNAAECQKAAERLSLPWSPTVFLNLYYAGALACAQPGSAGRNSELLPAFMEAFDRERLDGLRDLGNTDFAAARMAPLRSVDAEKLEGERLNQIFRLSATISSWSEARNWSLHRFYSELHGPYDELLENPGEACLVQSLNLDRDRAPVRRGGIPFGERIHLVMGLAPGAASRPALDFFGHLLRSLRSTIRWATVSVVEGGQLRGLSSREIQMLVTALEADITASVADVHSLSPEERCAGFGHRYLNVCLTAQGVADGTRADALAEFPRAVPPNGPWTGSRERFLSLLL